MIHVIIVEDDEPTRQGLVDMLSHESDIAVLADFASVEDALGSPHWTNCDILLTDIGLPGKSGIDLIRMMNDEKPNVQSVVLTVFEDDDHVFDALRAGANGYLLKTARASAVVNALLEVADGGSPMTGTIARKVLSSFKEKDELHSDDLTDRENQILRKLADGLRYKEIADDFGVSTETIRTHIRNIYRKLQVQSKIEAINKLRNLDR
jgi:two-component system, NarL family, response regulator LiaR